MNTPRTMSISDVPRQSQSSPNPAKNSSTAGIRSPKLQVRHAEHSRRVPVDARPQIVLIEHPRQPLGVNVIRLLLPPNQIQPGIPPQLLPANIEVPIPPPHLLAVPILRILLIQSLNHNHTPIPTESGAGLRPAKPSPTTTTKSGVNPRISRLAIPRQMSSQART